MFWKNLTVVSVHMIAGGAMFDKICKVVKFQRWFAWLLENRPMLVVVKWTFDELYYLVIIIFLLFFIVISYVPFMAVIWRIKVYIKLPVNQLGMGRTAPSRNTVLSNGITQCNCRRPESLSIGSPRCTSQFSDYIVPWLYFGCSLCCVVSESERSIKWDPKIYWTWIMVDSATIHVDV